MTPLFERELSHGLVVGVWSEDFADDAVLMAEELAAARDLTESRRRTFVAGRAAMRLALGRSALSVGPVMSSPRGAPTLPSETGVSISISHKEKVAVALVGARDTRRRVGVDIEIERPLRFDIARRVLTHGEMERMATLPEAQRGRFVLRRFSAKEAIYKAIDPFVSRYVAFREVSLVETGDGWRVELHLDPHFGLAVEVAQTIFAVERLGDVIVSTARARAI